MDDFDKASEREQRDRELAISNARESAPKLLFAGSCHNCERVLDAGLFCDADCRDDWDKRLKAQARG